MLLIEKKKHSFLPQNDPVCGSNKIFLNKDFNEIINDLKKNIIFFFNIIERSENCIII